MSDKTEEHEVPVDGRSLRSERSRRAAVEALLDLLVQGVARPTAQLVAERSGISLSTIFRLYEDLDALNAAAIAAQADRIGPMLVRFDLDASFDDRVRAFVTNRAKVYEAISPVRRFAKGLASSSPRIDTDLRRFDRYLRYQAIELFAPELRAVGDEADLDAVVGAWSSWDTWEQLRAGQQLSVRRTKAALASGLRRLLTSSVPDVSSDAAG